MIALENIIRPFVGFTGISPPPTLLYPPTDTEHVVCSLGGSGGRTFEWTQEGGVHVVISDDNKFRETSRKSTKVRVENPDDSSQFVEFCRADQINVKSQKTKTPATRQTTYDTSGGYHDLSGGLAASPQQTNASFNYKYPPDKNCVQQSTPAKGCKG